MTEPYEHVASPTRMHVHPDGSRCILTNLGRWMREAQGISAKAECLVINLPEVSR